MVVRVGVQTVIGLVLCTFAINEANAAVLAANLHKLRRHFERSEDERARSMSTIMQNMTSQSALEILKSNKDASPELVSLAQMAVSRTRLRATAPIEAPKGYSAVDGAKYMLNRLLEESMRKYDVEILKCRDYYAKQCGMIEQSRGTIADSSSKVAQCRTTILGAEGQIGNLEAKMAPDKQALADHRSRCKADVAALHAKLLSVKGDVEVMGKILGMTECGASLIQTEQHVGQGVHLLDCKRKCDKTSLLSIDHAPLRHHIDNLKSHVAQQLLQQSFSDLADDVSKDASGRNNSKPNLRKTLVPASPCTDPSKGAPTPEDKRAAKCTVSGKATCTKLQERFVLIQSGLAEGHDTVKDEIVKTEELCEDTEATLSKSVEKAEHVLKQHQTKLAEGTSCENEAAESGRLANTEFLDLTEEMDKMKAECSTNYQQFETEMCGLKKVRSELYTKMKGIGRKPFFQDCKLSDWTPGECSKECAGGVQEMTRSIETQPQGGAACLPLTEMRRCNEQPCPVDCRLGTWSGWSSCSAECGGGVQERLRDVSRNMKHNGKPCGETSETKACNVQSCEADCDLADWGKWAKCSKACDGGTRKRVRHVSKPAEQGHCPAPDSAERTMFKKCNSQACHKAKDKKTITCDAKLDLILLLDGSGSQGRKGWKATKKAAELLIGSLEKDKAQVAILLFSGPKTWPLVRKCYKSPVDQEAVCKQKWVTHMTGNLDTALQRVKFLGWPKGSTMTSLALQGALAETQLGRQDAETVVVVITDGKPLSKKATYRAAKAVRKVARLVWVPVTKYAPLRFIRRMASKRWQENVVLANNFKTLGSPAFVNHIIADMCPKIKS